MFAAFEIIGTIFISYLIYTPICKIKDCIAKFIKAHNDEKCNRDPLITEGMIQEAMENKTFGNFTLSEAVAILKDSEVIPSEGYKVEKQVMPDGQSQKRIIVSASGIKKDPELRFIFEDFLLSVAVEDGDSAIEALKDRLCIDRSFLQAADYNLVNN